MITVYNKGKILIIPDFKSLEYLVMYVSSDYVVVEFCSYGRSGKQEHRFLTRRLSDKEVEAFNSRIQVKLFAANTEDLFIDLEEMC